MSKSSPQSRLDLSQTPNKLWSYFAVIAVAILAVWLLFHSEIGYARARVQTITKDSVPSVVAAQEIRKGLFKMDGDTIANYLQVSRGGKATFDIDQDRATLAKQIVLAAQNITYGDAESVPIGKMVAELPKFSELASQATSDKNGITKLLAADALVHDDLVKSADDLDKVNRDHLNVAFDDSQGGLRAGSAATWVVGFIFLGLLAIVQLLISRLSHRRVNLPLFVGSLLGVIVVFSNARLMSAETETLREAKSDAFDSIGYLSEAEADAADARAEAFYGLILEAKTKSWALATHELAALADTTGEAELAEPYTTAAPPKFKGLLGNELRNITYDGEIEAANTELHAFAGFQRTLLAIQAKENASGPTDALQLAFASPDSVDSVYEATDQAIEVTKQINQNHFEINRNEAFDELSFPSISLNILCLGMLILAYFGIRQRVAEYVS